MARVNNVTLAVMACLAALQSTVFAAPAETAVGETIAATTAGAPSAGSAGSAGTGAGNAPSLLDVFTKFLDENYGDRLNSIQKQVDANVFNVTAMLEAVQSQQQPTPVGTAPVAAKTDGDAEAVSKEAVAAKTDAEDVPEDAEPVTPRKKPAPSKERDVESAVATEEPLRRPRKPTRAPVEEDDIVTEDELNDEMDAMFDDAQSPTSMGTLPPRDAHRKPAAVSEERVPRGHHRPSAPARELDFDAASEADDITRELGDKHRAATRHPSSMTKPMPMMEEDVEMSEAPSIRARAGSELAQDIPGLGSNSKRNNYHEDDDIELDEELNDELDDEYERENHSSNNNKYHHQRQTRGRRSAEFNEQDFEEDILEDELEELEHEEAEEKDFRRYALPASRSASRRAASTNNRASTYRNPYHAQATTNRYRERGNNGLRAGPKPVYHARSKEIFEDYERYF